MRLNSLLRQILKTDPPAVAGINSYVIAERLPCGRSALLLQREFRLSSSAGHTAELNRI